MPEIVGVILRYDHFDPDVDGDDDAITGIVGGITHDFKPDFVSLSATYESESLQGTDDPLAESIFVRMQAGF
jgi:hypothetical protein